MREESRKFGIDTSKHQASKVDYHKFRQAGGEFVFLRVGCGKTKDKCFENDYTSAVAAGLRVGVYFYTYSTTVQQAKEDASRVLGWLNGRKIDLYVVYDVEDDKQKGTTRKYTNTQLYNAFADHIKAFGYRPMLYTGEYFFNAYFDKLGLTDPLWIAKYSSKKPSVGRDYEVWQYTSAKVSASYYNGALDRNYMYEREDAKDDLSETVVELNPYPVPTRTLKHTIPNMRGNDVKWLQWELNRRNLLVGVDGIFGPKTKAAVISFQKMKSLLVDGKVGPATRFALLNS